MKTLNFKTPGHLDLNTVRLMGVSVKDSDNAIGRFGTGLKYAIASILREGGEVCITIGKQEHRLSTSDVDVRGKEFKQVILDDTPLGFTTELGKHWKPWMAIRELYSNTRDESGDVSLTRKQLKPCKKSTIITVTGDVFIDVWENKSRYFIDESDKPSHSCKFVEVFPNRCDKHVFYQRINIGKLESSAIHRYNILDKIDLSEDRSFKYGFQIREAVEKSIITSNNEDYINRCLTARDNYWESGLPFREKYRSIEPSKQFNKVMERFARHKPKNANAAALKWYFNRVGREQEYKEVHISSVQKQQLERAIECARRLGYGTAIDLYPITVVQSLGDSVHGRAKDGQIYLSTDCFRLGTKYVFSTLLEEYVHCHYGYSDHSRELQTYLFDQIASMTEEYVLQEPI